MMALAPGMADEGTADECVDLGLQGGLQDHSETLTRATASRIPARSRLEANRSSTSARNRSVGDTRLDTGVGPFLSG